MGCHTRDALVVATVILLVGACGDPGGGVDDPDAGDTDDFRPDGWAEESHGKDAEPDYDRIMPDGEVKRIDMEIAPDDWQSMMEEMEYMLGPFGAMAGTPLYADENIEACEGLAQGDPCVGLYSGTDVDGLCVEVQYGEILVCYPVGESQGPPSNGAAPILVPWDPMWVPCTVRFEGDIWTRVGMRFKGNSTLTYPWMYGDMKLPFKLDFDEFEGDHPEVEDQRFWGAKKISFANNARDSSYLREKVGGDLFRAAGIPAPRRAFYEVYLDVGDGPEYSGLYTAAEVPGKNLAEESLGGWGGHLYKPEGPAADWTDFDEASFPLKSSEEEADWSDVGAAVEALNADRSDPAAWREGLEAVFDVDGFIRWLALNTLIQDWDTYGYYAHNYYLYAAPSSGERLVWIPWDHNESLRPAFVDFDFEFVTEDWPLIRFVVDDPVYLERLRQAVAELVEGPFSAEEFLPVLEAEHGLIEPYVVGEAGEPEDHLLMEDPAHFDKSYEGIVEHHAARLEAAAAFAEGAGS